MASVSALPCTRPQLCQQNQVHTHALTHVYTHTHALTHVYTNIHIHTHGYSHTFTNKHTYTVYLLCCALCRILLLASLCQQSEDAAEMLQMLCTIKCYCRVSFKCNIRFPNCCNYKLESSTKRTPSQIVYSSKGSMVGSTAYTHATMHRHI